MCKVSVLSFSLVGCCHCLPNKSRESVVPSNQSSREVPIPVFTFRYWYEQPFNAPINSADCIQKQWPWPNFSFTFHLQIGNICMDVLMAPACKSRKGKGGETGCCPHASLDFVAASCWNNHISIQLEKCVSSTTVHWFSLKREKKSVFRRRVRK